MSPYFADDMFDIIKHQKEFSFYLAIFQIQATDHFFKNIRSSKSSYFYIFYKIRKLYFQNCIFTKLYFQRKRLK